MQIWDVIDPSAGYRVDQAGGYTDTSETPGAGTVDVSRGVSAINPQHQHFGFGVLLAGVGGLLYWIFEGKPSGGKIEGNLGPLDGELEGGLGAKD